MTIATDTTTKILKYSLWGCLYSVLITALLISAKFLFPFITLKTIFFRTLIEIATGLYILLALHNSYYRPKFNMVLWSLLAFGFIVLFTALIGVNPYHSLWGNIERGEGFLFISHLLAYSFILSQTFKKKFQWYNYFTFSILVSLGVGIYGLAQQLGWHWAVTNSAGGRWSSTLGNAAYLAAFALGHFWLSVMLWWQRPKIYWKFFYFITAIFNLFLIFNSQTRGALIALFITGFIYIIFLVFAIKNYKVKIILSILIILLIISPFVIWTNRDANWVNKYTSLRRLATISLHGITVESRLYALDSSWHAWQDRFLFGYGWENYSVAFNKYFHPEIYRDNGSQIWFDRAHNTIMDVAVATGLIGLLIYLSIFGSVVVIVIKHARQHQTDYFLVASLIGFLLAHFLQNIFVFDSLPTYIMLFSVFSFVGFLGSSQPHIQASKNIHFRPVNYYIVFVVTVITFVAIFNFNYRPAQANIMAIQGLQAFYYGKIDEGIATFQRAINMRTYQTGELRQRLAESILRSNNQSYSTDRQKIKKNFDIAINEIKKNIKYEPTSAQNYLYLMSLYNTAGMQTGNAEYLKLVVPTGKILLKLSPTRPQIYFEMGKAEISLKHIAQGIADFEQAVALNPKTLESHWNLLTAYIVTGQEKAAQKEYQVMLASGLAEDEASLNRLVNIYSAIKAHQIVVNIYNKLIKLNPTQINYWHELAVNYQALGDYPQAKATAQAMLTKFPEKSIEIKSFISQLEHAIKSP